VTVLFNLVDKYMTKKKYIVYFEQINATIVHVKADNENDAMKKAINNYRKDIESRITAIEENKEQHDCHASPEDGCEGCQKQL